MQAADALQAAAAQVDVIDAAGRIVANPKRNAIAASSATVLALATATERLWEICLEADLLVRALRFPQDTDENCAVADAAIAHQTEKVDALMTALRTETKALSEQENTDGNG